MRPSSFKLTPAIEKLLDELAAARNMSRAAVVREALVAYAARPISSAADAAGDLVGSLRGTHDLSTSPKHLADFGE